MSPITVKLSHKSYPVLITSGENRSLRSLLSGAGPEARYLVFFDSQFYALHGAALTKRFGLGRNQVYELVIPSGERSKSRAQLHMLQDYLLSIPAARTDLIVACGGGVTTDLVGYLAATTLRGIRWAAIPTTLLGMVDAAIGGKTAINHRLGKNLIGAFWHPEFVWCDVGFLLTLAPRQMIAGLGEVLKYAGLSGGRMIEDLRRFLLQGNLYAERQLFGLIRRSAEIKADIVGRDEREADVRMFLNFGHTFGHAIEKALGYGRLLHGEAVILGIVAALELGELAGKTKKSEAYRALAQEFVSLVPRRRIEVEDVIRATGVDKKRHGADLNYVLLASPGKPFIAAGLKPAVVRKAVQRMLAYYKDHGGKRAHHFGR
jgi:3-dehydroquinate synthase